MRAAIYLRKSRADLEAEQKGEGETLAKHRKTLLALAREQGFDVLKIRQEIVSGESLVHRPQMMELLKEVEAGEYDGVLVMDLDRLGRGNMQEQGLILETFRKTGTKIITPRKVYDLSDEIDEELSEIQAFFARKELKIINRRLYSGRVRSVKDGNWVGPAPYGYRLIKDEKGPTLEPVPEEAEIIRLIFRLYTHPDPGKRMGSTRIADKLNEMGIRKDGEPWQPYHISHLLRKAPVYAGMVRWRRTKYTRSSNGKKSQILRDRSEWIEVPGRHKPLIDQETFRKAQEYLQSRYHPPWHKLHGLRNPLSTLIKCGKCGRTMIRQNGWKDMLVCRNRKCDNVSSLFEYVEETLIDVLEEWLSGYRLQWKSGDIQEDQSEEKIIEKSILSLRRELKKLEQQRERLYDLLEQGVYTTELFMERSERLAARISDVQTSIKKAEQELEEERERNRARAEIIPRVEHVLEQYKATTDPKKKNALLKSVLEKVVYIKEKHERGKQFTLKVYPKLSGKYTQ